MSISKITCPYCSCLIDIKDVKVYVEKLPSKNEESFKDLEPVYIKKVKPLIVWEDKFELEINHIDEQHKKIVELINKINRSLKATSREEKFILDVISELEAYINEHFAYEENLFKKSEYPNVDLHLEQHGYFRSQVKNLQKIYEVSYISLNPILSYLVHWFIEHIQGIDRGYVQYLTDSNG